MNLLNLAKKLIETNFSLTIPVELVVKHSAFLIISSILVFMVLLLTLVKNAVKKLLLLGLVSVLVVFYWIIELGEFYYVYLGYLVAFTGAVLMLFLSVVLMLPAVIEKPVINKNTISTVAKLFLIVFFALNSDPEDPINKESRKRRNKEHRERMRRAWRRIDMIEKIAWNLGRALRIITFPIWFSLKLLWLALPSISIAIFVPYYTIEEFILRLWGFFWRVFPITELLKWGKQHGYLTTIKVYFGGLKSLAEIYRERWPSAVESMYANMRVKTPDIADYIRNGLVLSVPLRVCLFYIKTRNFPLVYFIAIFQVAWKGATPFDRINCERYILRFWDLTYRIEDSMIEIYKFFKSGRFRENLKRFAALLVIFFGVLVCTNTLLGAIFSNLTFPPQIPTVTNDEDISIDATTFDGDFGLMWTFYVIYQHEPALLILTALVLLVAVVGASIFFRRPPRS